MTATRFYLPSGGTTPTISPPHTAGTTSRRDTATTRQDTALATTNKVITGTYSPGILNSGQVQFVGPPMSARTISGNVSLVIKTADTHTHSDGPADDPAVFHVNIRVFTSANVLRGTVFNIVPAYTATADVAGQGWATTLETRIVPPTALTSLAVEDGDRLVITIACRVDRYDTHTYSLVWGDPSATADHTLSAGQTMVGVPWIEFSQDIFAPPAVTPVSTTRAATWNVQARVSTNRSALWNVLQTLTPISTTRSALWNVNARISTDRAALWNVLTSIATQRTAAWHVRSLTQTTREALWHVQEHLAVQRVASWHTQAQVETTRESLWDVKAQVTTERVATWHVRSLVETTRQAIWEVRERVAIERSASWNTKAWVSTQRIALWRVLARVSTNRSAIWDTLSGFATPPVLRDPRLTVNVPHSNLVITLPTSNMTLNIPNSRLELL